MKNIYLLAIIAGFNVHLMNAQNVGIGTDTPSAKLEVFQPFGNRTIVGANMENNPLDDVRVISGLYMGGNVGDHIGVYGYSQPTQGWGVGVLGQGGFYGVFSQGDMSATGVKAFTIDHPKDPENKILKHFAVESNEVLNLYRGVVVLDVNGFATIELPDYFELINKDFSYQLTGIGSAQQPYVSREIENNKFVVAGAPETKVSWTVYANRNDVYMQKNPKSGIDVLDKKGERRGKYFSPELYGQPKEKGLFQKPMKE